jgi:tetratricopeptide (TPR) repeat protein
VYAVLAAGPGWDWETLKELYPDIATYQAQLRDLETYQRANPAKGSASLLLAYHYLTLGYTDEAATQLKNAAKAEPKDQLAPALLKAIEGQPRAADDKPKPGGP